MLTGQPARVHERKKLEQLCRYTVERLDRQA